jgi:hypothetical protein
MIGHVALISLNSIRKFIPRAFESFANTRENIDPRISRSFFDPLKKTAAYLNLISQELLG